MRKRGIIPSHFFEHLSCFFPGLLALGVHLLPLNDLDTLGINVTALADDLLPDDRQAFADLAQFNLADLHLWAAEGIAQACYLTYADQPSGLGPEIVRMDVDPELGALRWIDAMREWKAAQDGPEWEHTPPGVGEIKPWTGVTAEGLSKGNPSTSGRDYSIQNTAYYLRPEVRGAKSPRLCMLTMLVAQTVESFYILWRTTGDVKWRHRGWDVFQAIQRHTKTDSGYSSVLNVDTAHPTPKDEMPR